MADHLVGRVDAGLGFAGPRLGSAPQPLDFGLHHVAQALLLAVLRFQVGLLFFEKAAEIALHAQQAVGINPVQLDNLARRGFEKIAVVADRDGGKGAGGEQLFEPLDPRQIKVVGRLVQQHHLGLANQRLGDGQPLAPSAAEPGGLGVEVQEAGAAGEFPQTALAFGFVDLGGGQSLLQNLADREARGKARVLGHIGGASPFAHRQLA